MSAAKSTRTSPGTRIEKPKIIRLESWLSGSSRTTSNGRYRHRLLRENQANRQPILNQLLEYYKWAHNDALMLIRKIIGEPLDPLGEKQIADPLMSYSCNLDIISMQGCFGEVFAGMVVEQFGVFGEAGWEVPAFLLQFHNTLFEELESRNPQNPEPRRVFGRTGDDCLTFRRNADGRIVCVLYVESKCSQTHDASLIADAHEKICSTRPVNIHQLIDILQRRGDEQSLAWVDPLRRARLSLMHERSDCERRDLVSYICGQRPIRSETWMNREKPHEKYSSTRRFEAVEIHLSDVEALIRAVYDGRAWA